MDCVLCLEALKSSEFIHITNEEKLNLRCVIEQHFPWLKIDSQNNEDTVCFSCSQALTSFHEFYLQIESAHKFLKNNSLCKPVENCIFVEPEVLLTLTDTETGCKEDVLDIRKDIKTDLWCKRKSSRTQRFNKEVKSKSKSEKRILQKNIKNKLNASVLTTECNSELINNSSGYPVKTIKKNEQRNVSDGNRDSIVSGSETDSTQSWTPSTESSKNSPLERKFRTSGSAVQERDAYIASHLELSCSICEISLRNFANLQIHFRDEHQQRGYVMCCGKKLSKKGRLIDHLRTHEDPSYFKCHRCGKVLSGHDNLQYHLKNCKQSRERKLECKICKKKFYTIKTYERHKLIHVPEEEKTVPCPECEKTFAAKSVMNAHLKSVHMNAYSKVCDICGKSISGYTALQRHINEHLGVPVPIVQCSHCGLNLTSQDGLRRHIKVMHVEENRQPLTCPICFKVSPGNKAHRQHIAYMHKTEAKHVCSMCGKAFKRPLHLKEHMTTHTGQMLYTCAFCPKSFRTNAHQYTHMKKSHPKEFEERKMARYNKN